MKLLTPARLYLALAAASALAGCTPDGPPPAPKPAGLQSSPAVTAKAPATDDQPIPPADAVYTMYCQAIQGPDHLARSSMIRRRLAAETPLKGWYVIHSADHSTLYYGFYRAIDPRDKSDSAEGERAQKDLATLRAVSDGQGGHPFLSAVPVTLDAPDPDANPAWDLSRCKGYWSIEIAVYKGSPERKRVAVDSVRALRETGVEAYYYHGPDSSSVCIGSWPAEAAKLHEAAELNNNPDVPLIVTPTPLPDKVVSGLTHAGAAQVVAPHLELLDPTLMDALHRYPDHYVNGERIAHKRPDPVNGQMVEVPDPSFVVRVPERNDMNDMSTEGGAPAAAMQPRTNTPAPGVGSLKAIPD